jgi:hypothetical protein
MVGVFLVHGFNYKHTQIHKTHHGLDLREATTFPLIILFVINHRGYIQISFSPRIPKLGVSKFTKLGFSTLWKPIIFFVDFRLRWCLKQCYNLYRKFFNNKWHATFTHIFPNDFRLLVVRSQIDTLTFGFSFGHNLCFKYSNGSCEPILNI